MENQIDEKTKKERVRKIISLSEELEKEYMNEFINQEVYFLPETYKDGYLFGHTSNYLLIKAKGSEDKLNISTKVTIKKIEYPYCISEMS